jgi:hypothetical protein
VTVIHVASASRCFMVKGNMLSTSDGTKPVGCFRHEGEVNTPMQVEILGKSCFESRSHVQ